MLFDLVAQAAKTPLSRSVVEPALEKLAAHAREQAPGIEAPLALVARNVAERLDGAADPEAAVRALDPAEMWLAAASAANDEAALERVERRYFASLPLALAHMKLDDDALDDVVQTVWEKLLAPNEAGVTCLEQSAGNGKLGNFIRVVAVRTALDHVRGMARRTARRAPAAVDALMDGALAPDLQLHKQRYRESFKTAFQAALAELPPRKRGVLRMHLLERLTIDDIAALHHVHRSSAARWLTDIRTELGKATRRQLRAELKLSSSEFEALFEAVESQLDLSFTRILSATTSSG